MLFYDATLRNERRHRRMRVMDIAVGTIGGKPASDHIAKLKD